MWAKRRMWVLSWAAAALLVASIGCGSDGNSGSDGGKKDGKIGSDAGQKDTRPWEAGRNDAVVPRDHNCNQSIGCVVACQGDATCLGTCYAQTCEEAVGPLIGIADCLMQCATPCQTAGKTCDDCLAEKCAKALTLCHLNACAGQAPPPVNCGEASSCVTICGSDTACVQQCDAARCASAKTTHEALEQCVSSSCATECTTAGQGCTDCTLAKCSKPFVYCSMDRCSGQPSPNFACGALALCRLGCGDDSACTAACDKASCSAAVTTRNAIDSCQKSKCVLECVVPGLGTCQTCVDSKCQTEITACVNHSC